MKRGASTAAGLLLASPAPVIHHAPAENLEHVRRITANQSANHIAERLLRLKMSPVQHLTILKARGRAMQVEPIWNGN
jgi:hypothetical protein